MKHFPFQVKASRKERSWVYAIAILASAVLLLPAQGESLQEANAEKKLIESVDRVSLPVIELEQLYVPPTGQRYRIEIYATGRANYQGLIAVKTLGQVDFDISEEQIRRIIQEFERLDFWNMKEKQYGTPGLGQLYLRFTIRWMGKAKTVSFVNLSNDLQLLLKDIIEREVRTEQWRCPFVDALRTSRELCAFEAARESRNLELYLKRRGGK